ncbi:MAG TPA: N-acetylmuramoyl-L-alanine amidase [Candidatus Dormibacteraeota bacterium]
MRLRARLLYVLVIAPAVAVLAAASGLTVHAQDTTAEPQPVIIALDPGHGGAPIPGNPTQPFDPGAISADGLMEKVVTLDVAQRVAVLLRQDLVSPVLTRTSDTWVTISDREQIAIDAHAERFVSIHCNSYADSSASGSLVLYPGDASLAFAQTIANNLGTGLAPSGVPDQGVVLRDDWWIHNPMPTATAEIAYLSNPREAALLASADFRQQVAVAIRNGIEQGDPDIATRKAQLLAWRQAHPGATPRPAPVVHPVTQPAPASHSATAPGGKGGAAGAVLAVLVLLGVGGAVVWYREPLLRATGLRRAAARRRRRRVRLQTLTAITEQRWVQRSVYDDLPF